jgi:hypothetical protein
MSSFREPTTATICVVSISLTCTCGKASGTTGRPVRD